VTSLVSGETSRQTLEVLSVPKLSTRNGQEVGFLVGDRKEIPTETDPLADNRRTLDEPAAALPARDFGLKLNLHPIILPNGLIRVRVRPQITSVNATLRKGRYVPAVCLR
jgi:Flp pilus assembly secretin CpaC